MNKVVTSKAEILKACKEIVVQNGIRAINMRSVAKACHVSVGSVYNYFDSKSELVEATVEDIWKNIFHGQGRKKEYEHFTDFVQWFFDGIREGASMYPEFFTARSVGFECQSQDELRPCMNHYFDHMKRGLLAELKKDRSLKPGIFKEEFMEAEFIDFIFKNILLLLMDKEGDCKVLISVIERVIYE